MTLITEQQKRDLAIEVDSTVTWIAKTLKWEKHKCCLLYTAIAEQRLSHDFGMKVYTQGGTAYWPIVDHNEPDDGKRPNVFGYEFDSDDAYMMHIINLLQGETALPEMHVWLLWMNDDVPTVIDFSYGQQAVHAEVEKQLTWEYNRPDLLDFVWEDEAGLRKKMMRYKANRQACEIAQVGMDITHQQFQEKLLESKIKHMMDEMN